VPQAKGARAGKDAFAPWLAAERCLDVDAAVIREAAKQLTGTDDEELARAAARAGGKQLTHTGFSLDEAGAARGWQTGKGGGTAFSDAMVSLLRARGVPARHCSGWLVDWDTVPCHSWVEVWCRGRGWVLFDPSAGQKYPDRLLGSAPIYVQLSTVRNDAR